MSTYLRGAPADILSLDLIQLRLVHWQDWLGLDRYLMPAEFDHIFKHCAALWQHSGNPENPHAELTSGKCSDGFADALRVLRRTGLCWLMANQMVRRLRENYDGPVDWVVASDHAGAAIGFAVATLLRADFDFTEKGPNKTQLWQRHVIESGQVVLQVEELITTTGTLEAVREGIRLGNPYPVTFAPVVITLVHRSSLYEFEDSPILHVRHYDIAVWDGPAVCPLCQAGSKRILPKKNWAALTAA